MTTVNTSDTNIEVIQHAWATSKNRFWAPTSTAKRLPAGVYNIGSSDRIGGYLDMVKVVKDDLVIVPGMGADSIIAEIKKFWDAKDKYKARGVVHKRGILMEGPPGSGKTSNTELVIEMFLREFDGIVFLGNGSGDIGSGLRLLKDREPDRPVLIVIEDIDAAIRGNEEGILQLLDGKDQFDGVLFVATTNHLDKLPDRIANRPSRFDLVVKIALPSDEARSQFLRLKEPGLDDARRAEIVAATDGYSIAHLKELMLLIEVYGVSLDDAAARIKAIMERKLLPQQAAMKTVRENSDFGIQPTKSKAA